MFECPRCKSNVVTTINNDLLCLHCGNREALEDYPIAAASYCRPVEKDEPTPEPIPPSQSQMWDKIQQLRGQAKYLENKIIEHIDKGKKRKGDYV